MIFALWTIALALVSTENFDRRSSTAVAAGSLEARENKSRAAAEER